MEIERRPADDGTRPTIYYPRSAYCSYPYVKNLTIMVNSNYNGWRFEDVWLDRLPDAAVPQVWLHSDGLRL